MASVLQILNKSEGRPQSTKKRPIASGVAIQGGDIVGWNGSGRIDLVTTGLPLGIVPIGNASVTGNAGGTNLIEVIEDPTVEFIMDNDQDSATFAITDVGKFGDITGGTGVQKVDTSSLTGTPSSSLPLKVLEYNPQIDLFGTDVSIGVFGFANHFHGNGSS